MAPDGRTGTVHGYVSAAYDHHTFAGIIRNVAPADLSQHFHCGIDSVAVHAVYVYRFTYLGTDGNIDRIVLLLKLLHGDIPADGSIVMHCNITGRQDRIDIFVQSVLGQTVIGNTVSQHSSQRFSLFVYIYLMSHQRQIIGSGQSGRTSSYDSYFFAGGDITLRHLYLICCNLIHREFLQSTDIDRAVYQVSAAFCLTRVFTDKCACRGKRIVPADQIDGICITMFTDQRNISRNIHMCGAMGNTGNLLSHFRLTSVLFNMAHVFITEQLHTLQYDVGRLVTYGTVCRILNHFRQGYHIVKGLHIRLTVQNAAHHILYLFQSVTARNTFTAGLTSGTL